MILNNVKISRNSKPYVIAEIGNNHQGDIDIALKMIKIAKEYCNVDAVKFQKRENKELFTEAFYNKNYDNENSYGETYGKHREFLEFGKSEYIQIKKLCEEIGVDLIVTPFEETSLKFLEEIGIGIYKVASSDVKNIPLIKAIAQLKKPIIVSTGGCDLEDIKIVNSVISEYHNNFALLHCIAKYPPKETELNLNIIKLLSQEFKDTVIGYSGHDVGIKASLLANAMGATIIEKHFTLDKNLKGTDHKISLNPDEMKKLVEELNNNYEMFGKSQKVLNEYEISAVTKLGKSIYSKVKINKGEKLTYDNICLKSPGGFVTPQKYYDILGKVVTKDIEKDCPIALDTIL